MTDDQHAHHDEGFAHPVPVWILLATFFSLVTLTILTVVLNGLPLGALDIWVAMGIATVKASLVCLFFMHMFWEKGFNVVAFFSSLFFVSLFIGFTLMDTGSYRDDIDAFPQDKQPDPRIPRTGLPGVSSHQSTPLVPPRLVGQRAVDSDSLIDDVRI
jgi:cytochrome c oxidase subunit 4